MQLKPCFTSHCTCVLTCDLLILVAAGEHTSTLGNTYLGELTLFHWHKQKHDTPTLSSVVLSWWRDCFDVLSAILMKRLKPANNSTSGVVRNLTTKLLYFTESCTKISVICWHHPCLRSTGDSNTLVQTSGVEDPKTTVADNIMNMLPAKVNPKHTYLHKINARIAQSRSKSADIESRPDREIFIPILQRRHTWPHLFIWSAQNSATTSLIICRKTNTRFFQPENLEQLVNLWIARK